MLSRKSSAFKEGFDTLVGKNATFIGSVEVEGSVRVDGKVEGDLSVKGDVYIGTEATVVGNIHATNVFMAGTHQGNVYATGTLKIDSTAKLFGDIEVASFVTNKGAIFKGKCSMLQDSVENTSKNESKTDTSKKK